MGRRMRILIGLAETVTTKQEDLRVFDETIGNGRGDGGVEEDVTPFGKRGVGRDDRTPLAAMPG